MQNIVKNFFFPQFELWFHKVVKFKEEFGTTQELDELGQIFKVCCFNKSNVGKGKS